MTITPRLFEAFLKCPTKSWLRFTGEPPAGNTYAEWVQTENESYRADAGRRLMANAAEAECAIAPASANLKTAQWRFAVEIELRSSRGNEAQTSPSEINQSLLTSAATVVESRLHAGVRNRNLVAAEVTRLTLIPDSQFEPPYVGCYGVGAGFFRSWRLLSRSSTWMSRT